jgi:hypothetical protein
MRFERFSRSPMSVAEFCRREDVSVASFYQWRRRLATTTTAEEVTVAKQSARPMFLPVQVVAGANVQVVFPNGTRLTLPAHDHELVKLSIESIAMAPTTTGEA